MKKKIYAALVLAGLTAVVGCKDFLDVNTNPNGPEKVAPNLYLASIESSLALGVQYDARYMGKYVQNFVSIAANDAWDRHGYVPVSDAGGELWKSVYWKMGMNNEDMINLSLNQQRWDLAGIGYALKAWGFQALTDVSGEIIITEAFKPENFVFKYDTQEFAYEKVRSLCDSALVLLNRTDGAVSQSYTAKGDIMYKGDRTKWIKFVYAVKAINAAHMSNKTDQYKPAQVIEFVDKAFSTNDDDALIPFNGVVNSDANFFGPFRNNIASFVQSEFITNALNGTVFNGVSDPRISALLAKADDGLYYGIKPTLGTASVATNQVPYTLWGTKKLTPGQKGKYLFDDKANFPLMTYAQLQFIKAEAAFNNGDKATALDAYKKGISAHIDFVNKNVPTDLQVSPAAKTSFLANTAIVPADAASLTLSQIMMQKYIAQFGWGFVETWFDLRRYHYNSTVFTGFTLPTELYPDNNGKPVYRLRPRYNSEYVWNVDALTKIGAMEPDYHTKEMWVTQ